MDYCRGLVISLLLFAACQSGTSVHNVTESPRPAKLRPRDRKQYRPGDILLGGALHISTLNEDGECVEEITGMQTVELVNMMIDEVNANDSILPGVQLGTVMIDTCGSESHALQRVIMDVLPLALSGYCEVNCADEEPQILAGVIGGSVSSVSMQIARILQVFYIPQISYWSTSVELSDKEKFKYFFRSVAPDIYQVDAMMSFVKQMGWNYISVIYEDDNYGVDGYAEIFRVAEKNDICIALSKAVSRETGSTDAASIIDELLAKARSRVVILFTHGLNTEKLLRAAQENEAAVGSFAWMGCDAWTRLVPINNRDKSFLDALDGAIGFQPKIIPIPGFVEYMTNLTLKQNYGENLSRNPWFADYISRRNDCFLPGDPDHAAGRRMCDAEESIDPANFRTLNIPISDVVKAYIYALDAYHREKCSGIPGLCEEIKRKTGTNEVARELFPYLQNLSFTSYGGTTFKFDENQDGPARYDATVFDKGKVAHKEDNIIDGWVNVGTYQDSVLKLHMALPERLTFARSTCSDPCGRGEIHIQETQICCWHCHKCLRMEYVLNGTACRACDAGFRPNETSDGCEPVPIRKMEYWQPHSIVSMALGAFGITCTMYVTVIFIYYRETALVRASGKELCFFVLFGIFVTLLNCFTVTSHPSAVSCTASRAILAIGPACMYVGMLMKTIRIAFIFQSRGILSLQTKKYLQPAQFTLLTAAVTSIQIIVVVVWCALTPPTSELFYVDDFAFLTCNVLIDPEIFVGLVFPFSIIIICTVLATLNRNIPTGFKETLYIGFTMYTICVIWLTFLLLFLTNSTDVPKKLTTVSTALSLSAITVLMCLFGPRCWAILFHPEWNTSEIVMSSGRNYEAANERISTVQPDVATSVTAKRSDMSDARNVGR